jgi:hypothetical protein
MATRKQTESRTAGKASETRDFRVDLTNNIVGLIEQGVAPWQKPWNAGTLALPFNATTQRGYRGGNALHLLARQHQLASDDPRWCTYKQAKAAGWQIRKGEKATTVEYWQFDREEEQERDDGSIEKVRVKFKQPRVFYAQVFNAKQIDGIPPYQAPEPRKQWEISDAAEQILANCGVPIHHDQLDRAFYSPVTDSIHLPTRQNFSETGDYYEVALHEVAHSSGHVSRLNRDLSGRFGSPEYAREELRAQMCSLFLSAELGVPFNPERHAAYQASWIKALQEDKNEIFRAARDAELMADYVIGLSREHILTKGKENEMTEMTNPGATTNVAPKSPGLSTYQMAHDDVAAYMDTAIDAKAERASLAKEMHNKAKTDPDYRAALERITPDLSTLTNARTTVQQRESLYAAELEARKQRKREDPEIRDERERMEQSNVEHANGKENFYLPRDNGKYTGQIIEVNENYVLQQLRESNSFVAHPTDKLNGQQVKVGDRHTMEYRDGALTVRAPEQSQGRTFNSELVQLKNEHAGKDAKLVMAKDDNGKAYTGTIIAESGNKVLQRVSDKYVVVHDKDKLARDVEVGSNKTLAYENGRISVLEPSQNRNRSRIQEAERAGERAPDNKGMTPEQERRESFFHARGIIMSQFGSQSKVRDAKTDIGDYKGAVVAITKEHVAQQLGANSFVVHEKDRLAGNFQKGSHVEIKYNNGRAISALTQKQREQNREQSKGVSR